MRKTFLGVDTIPHDVNHFGIIGICACSAEYLCGVEKAPKKLRELSSRYANADGTSLPLKVYSPERGYILKKATIYDYGDVYATSLDDLDKQLSNMQLKTGCIPVFIGGDHSVTYQLVKKVSEVLENDDIVVVQFDAHSDFIDEYEEYPHGSVMKKVSGIQNVKKIIHFGIRGNLNSYPAIKDSIANGNIVIPYYEISKHFSNMKEYLKDKKVYITIDTDFMNPCIASATNCPEPGGPGYDEALNYILDVIEASCSIVGIDFVEYNPLCEGATLTGITIVNLIMESIGHITEKLKN